MLLFISFDKLESVLPSSKVMISLGGILLLYSLERFRIWLDLRPEIFPRIFSILRFLRVQSEIKIIKIITIINFKYKEESGNFNMI